jgi:hypothetical protein
MPLPSVKKRSKGLVMLDFNLLRRHPVVERSHHHHGNVDLGKQIDRHARYGGHANHGNHHANHDDEERIANREA